MHPLDGPRLKVKRAREHASNLDRRVQEFLHANPYQAIGYDDAEARSHLVRVKVNRQIPIEWAMLVH